MARAFMCTCILMSTAHGLQTSRCARKPACAQHARTKIAQTHAQTAQLMPKSLGASSPPAARAAMRSARESTRTTLEFAAAFFAAAGVGAVLLAFAALA